jgi:hypothetical protein
VARGTGALIGGGLGALGGAATTPGYYGYGYDGSGYNRYSNPPSYYGPGYRPGYGSSYNGSGYYGPGYGSSYNGSGYNGAGYYGYGN